MTEQEAIEAVQAWLAQASGRPTAPALTAQPYRDGFVVGPATPTVGAPLFAVRRGLVGIAPSNQQPTLEEVWDQLVARQG